jgi:acetyl esterase/lipase
VLPLPSPSPGRIFTCSGFVSLPSAGKCVLYFLAVSSEDILSKPPPADLRVEYGSDANQFVDVRLPAGKGPHPVVFFIHGGYWRARYDLTYAGHLCHALKKDGLATWNVEYRRVGQPGGGWPGTFEDIRTAFRAMTARAQENSALDHKRVCVAGHSAGGQLALCLAAHEPSVTRVLSLAGVLDLRRAWELHLSNDAVVEFLGGPPSQVPEHYREASPAEQRIPRAAQRLIHGTADDDVPYEISRAYAEQKRKTSEKVELITLPQTGHYEIVDPGSNVGSRVQETFVFLTRT